MRTIDISGPDGNAFYLMGIARKWARDLEWSKEKIDALFVDMKSSDYDHLVECFENAFEGIVEIVR